MHCWAEVPNITLIQRIIPAQVDEGFDPEKGDPPPEGGVVFRSDRSALSDVSQYQGNQRAYARSQMDR